MEIFWGEKIILTMLSALPSKGGMNYEKEFEESDCAKCPDYECARNHE